MTKTVFALALSLFMAVGILPARAAFVPDAAIAPVMRRAVDEAIVPGYNEFRKSAGDMTAAMETLCTNNSPPAYGAAMKSFAALVAAWSRIEILRDGPALEKNRFERILFFPDRKGIALRQIQALLASNDEAQITLGAMKSKSVAVQGIGALEYVLAGSGKEELSAGADNFRCHAGRAVARNIEMLAQQLADAWNAKDGVAHDWKTFGPQNPVYRNGEEALIGLLGTLVRGIEMVNEKRLSLFYAQEGKIADAHRAIYRRSGLTMASIANNLEGLRTIWENSGMKGIIKGEGTAITGNIDFDFKTVIQTASRMNMPVEKILADDDMRSRLDFLFLTLADLQARLNNDYGRAMGLDAGFSFSDGD